MSWRAPAERARFTVSRWASQRRTSAAYASSPMRAASSARLLRYTGSAPTWASVFEEQYQSRSWPPGPQPRRSYSAIVTSR